MRRVPVRDNTGNKYVTPVFTRRPGCFLLRDDAPENVSTSQVKNVGG